MTDEHEKEFRDEAERLRQLSPEDQQAFVAMLRKDAENRKVSKRDRDFARERACALEKLLGNAQRPRQFRYKIGSTRMRLFTVLFTSLDPMTPKGIMKRTGMLTRSGHLYDVLREEVKKGRIYYIVYERGVRGYELTRAGRKAFSNGEIDKGPNAGKRIGKGRKVLKADAKKKRPKE